MASITINNTTTTATLSSGTESNALGVAINALLPPNAPLNFSSMVTLFRNVTPSATEPSDPVEGYVYLDDGSNTVSGTMGFRRYDGTEWDDFGLQTVAGTTTLADLSDVTISAIINGERLVYNATSGEWENSETIDGGLFSD